MKIDSFSLWAVMIFCFLGLLAGVGVGQIVVVQQADARLQRHATNLLKYSTDVATEAMSALAAANRGKDAPCSDEDIQYLRTLSFKTVYFRDVGRIRDGYLLCTALWSRLSPTVKLPPPDRRGANGDSLWSDAVGLTPSQIPMDMGAYGTAIVFSSPSVFQPYVYPASDTASLVQTHDGAHVYRAFGETSRLRGAVIAPSRWYDLRTYRRTRVCAEDVDVCVVDSLSDVSILQRSRSALFSTAGLGALSGCSFAIALISRRSRQSSLHHKVKRAVAADRITMVYQPLIMMRDGRIIAAEALARIVDDDGSPIPADVFIRIAEEIGIIADVTRIVIRKAIGEMSGRLLRDEGFHLAINIAVSDLLDEGLLEYLETVTAGHGICRQQIVLEITERSTANHDCLVETMQKFRKRGYRFSIDDFGTGYSNLAYLARLPIDGIKVDRMFTQAIGTGAVSSTIIRSVSFIAAELHLNFVVEGIETKEQAAYILSLHPDAIGQGWLYARPVKAADFPPGTTIHV